MNTQNYPSWLVSVEQAKRLKKIGFDEPCQFFLPIKMYEDFDTKELEFDFQKENHNESVDYWSIPSYEQVFEWFREKGFRITLINYEDISKFSFYNMKIRGGVYYAGAFNTYEEAREELVKTLIETYKTNEIL